MKMFNPGIMAGLFLILNSTVLSKPEIRNIWTIQDTVGLYEKFEASMDIRAVFNNPFDPGDIDISVKFVSPSGRKWNIHGFYNNTWTLWMVRFSPNETGRWIYTIQVKDMEGRIISNPDTLSVIPSEYHGPIRISTVNHRYLEYADGTPYYGVGLWYNSGLYRLGRGKTPPEVLDDLKEWGINFVSTVLPPIETWGTGLGRYDQNICSRLDDLLSYLEERDILLSLNLWFHSFLSETIWPGGNRRWHTNPYALVCEAKDFYSSIKAWEYQEKLYRYLISRWGYSRSLAIWFIVDEVNGTDGWAYGDSLGAARWGKKVHDYFKKNDPYGHLTTGTRSGGFREWWHEGYHIFDLAGREIYEAQGFPILKDGKIDPQDPHPLKLSYMNYASEIQKLWNGYKKPCIVGETGWDHTFYEPSMPGYLAQYHNVLWVSVATGLSMTPFWWAYSPYINDNVLTGQITSIARFTSNIPFSQLIHVNPVEAALSNGDAFALKSDQLIFGWVVNPSADIAGATVTVTSVPEGEYTLKIYHTWRGEYIHGENIICENQKISFTIPVLKIEDGHGKYIGQDAAFILEPVK